MEWESVKLELLSKFIRNGLSVKQSSDQSGLPITRIETISNGVIDPQKVGRANIELGQKDDWLLKKGDILLSHINSESHIGKCALYEGKPNYLIHGMNLLCIRLNDNVILPQYFLYYAKGQLFKSQIIPITKRAINQASISINDFKKVEVPLPPLFEQKRIVEILDRADELRKRRAEADALSERILPALFIKMFGDPATNPMGWEEINLSCITEDFRYGTSARCHLEKEGYPVLRIPNILKGEIELNDLKYTELSSSEVKRLLLRKGDLLFVRTNGNPDYVGRCAVADLPFPCLYASYLIRARLNQNKINPHFLSSYLQTPAGRQSMIPSVRTTAGQSNINIEGLKQIALFLPPITLQNSFVEKIDSVKFLSTQREKSKLVLENLFQNLLYRAFSGDLTAQWREAHMTELLQEMEHQAKALNLQSTLFEN